MIEIISFITGVVVGVTFGALKLPVPAPETIAGLLGIVGLYFGFKLAGWLL